MVGHLQHDGHHCEEKTFEFVCLVKQFSSISFFRLHYKGNEYKRETIDHREMDNCVFLLFKHTSPLYYHEVGLMDLDWYYQFPKHECLMCY